METYEQEISNLIDVVKHMHESAWSPTESRNKIERIAQALEKVAELLEDGSAQFDIEIFHDKRGIPEMVTGLDGWPVEESAEREWPTYQGIKWEILLLAESAHLTAEQLSRPEKALAYAARRLLYLRQAYDFNLPKLYNNSLDIKELERVCNAAGIFLSAESYRGALAKALQELCPDGRAHF